MFKFVIVTLCVSIASTQGFYTNIVANTLAAVSTSLSLANLEPPTLAPIKLPLPSLPLLPTVPLPGYTSYYNQTPAQLSQSFKNITDLLDNAQKTGDHGVAVPYINGLPIAIGLVTLPLNFLCNQTGATQVILDLTCHVCTDDCTFVHNKYGGRCGPDLNPGAPEGSQKCICNDLAPANGHVLTATEACGVLVTGLGEETDYAITNAFVIRRELLQCNANVPFIYGSTGCGVDCVDNHAYPSGDCKTENGIPLEANQTATTNPPQPYCDCGNYPIPTSA